MGEHNFEITDLSKDQNINVILCLQNDTKGKDTLSSSMKHMIQDNY